MLIRMIRTPVNTVIASSTLDPSVGYDSRHLFQIPLTLNFGKNSTFSKTMRFLAYTKIIYSKWILNILQPLEPKHTIFLIVFAMRVNYRGTCVERGQ